MIAHGVRGVAEFAGSGPPAVLLASPLARAKSYQPTTAALARSFRLATIEMPGSGTAESVGAGWSVGQYAGWVANAIAALGLERPLVVGHSHSGAIGMVLAARYPEAVGRLVLADATGARLHRWVQVFSAAFLDAALELDIVVGRWHHVVGNLFMHPRNFVKQVWEAVASDVRADAARIGARTLVAWGRRDHTLPHRDAAEFLRQLPNAEAYICESGSHDWLISHPAEFATAVTAFARRGAL